MWCTVERSQAGPPFPIRPGGWMPPTVPAGKAICIPLKRSAGECASRCPAREGSSLIDHPYKKKPLEAALPLSRKGRRRCGWGIPHPAACQEKETPTGRAAGHPSLRRRPRKGSPHRQGGIERFSLSIQSDLSACTFSMPGGKADLTIRSNTHRRLIMDMQSKLALVSIAFALFAIFRGYCSLQDM